MERWFGIITEKAIRRGTFQNVKELVNKIDSFVKNYNKKAKPFVWTATPESIFLKIKRLCERYFWDNTLGRAMVKTGIATP